MAGIIICGYMIRNPLAGNLFAFFHYILGLHRLGHKIFYLEESGGWAEPCYDPHKLRCTDSPESGLRMVKDLLARYDVRAPACYINRESGETWGVEWGAVKDALGSADLLLNIGGICWLPEFRLCPRRALIDMDPLFSQAGRFGSGLLDEHHIHFSYGANIGKPGCAIPTAGINWVATAPPVVSDLWRGDRNNEGATFTTVASWDAYGEVMFKDEVYGQKDLELIRFLDLPSLTSQDLEIALAGPEEVRERIRKAGWSVRDAGEISVEAVDYVSYILGSRGEFSFAKNAYVKSNSGWFSDRSVCYLAAGLPVVLQDTGFSDWLPAGRGVFAFKSMEDAVECLEKVNAQYSVHRCAAREIAERVFSYRVVLPRLLDAALKSSSATV